MSVTRTPEGQIDPSVLRQFPIEDIVREWNDGMSMTQLATKYLPHVPAIRARNTFAGFIFRMREKGFDFRSKGSSPKPQRPREDIERREERLMKKRIDERRRYAVNTGKDVSDLPPKPERRKKEKVERSKQLPSRLSTNASFFAAATTIDIKPLNVSLFDLESNGCRWIVDNNEDDGALYCGLPQHVHKSKTSYCEGHHWHGIRK